MGNRRPAAPQASSLEQLALREGEVLVAPLLTSRGSAIFVVTGSKQISAEDVVPLDGVTDGNLRDLLQGTNERPGWLKVYARWLHASEFLDRAICADESGKRNGVLRAAQDEYLAATQEWDQTIDYTCSQLWDLLAGPIHARLTGRVPKDARVVVLPSKWLSLLPLHAAWHKTKDGRRYFLDDYTISYVPSCFVLATARQRIFERAGRPLKLLAVVNPTGDLDYAAAEAQKIATSFSPESRRMLPGPEATSANACGAAANCTHLHFAGHAAFNWGDPPSSGVVLARGIPFTIRDIAANLSLDCVRLVTLSACETGITEFEQAPNEFTGLPAALIQVGAPGVISSLWAVDDDATATLMGRFYYWHITKGAEPAEALRQAQIEVKRQAETDRPFFWAAFTAVGA